MSTFAIETVDEGGVRGQCTVALDGAGNPHIAYTVNAGHVVFARHHGSGWTTEALGANPRSDPEARVLLEIDSQGNPHIAFIDETSGHLFHGVRVDGSWTFTPVPSNLHFLAPGGVIHPSFKLHPGHFTPELRDTPHFVFGDLSTDSMGYTRLVNGELKLVQAAKAVDLSGDGMFSRTGLHTSIAFDESSDTIQICYVEEAERVSRVRLRRVLNPEEGEFSNEQVLASGTFVVSATSVWTGSETWVAYCDITNGLLKAATHVAGEPVVEEVANVAGRIVPSLARNAALAVNPEESVRIAYSENNKIHLAVRRRAEGWKVEDVDATGGELPSLVYDKSGNAHIAYKSGSSLKYARGKE